MSASQKRVNSIISKVPSIQKRLKNTPVTTQPRQSGRGEMSFDSSGPIGMNINENFIKRGSTNDTTLQATIYHESIHAEQMRNPVLKADPMKYQPVAEFHAHSRALRHAMKLPDHDVSVAHSTKKMKKYGALVQDQFPHLTEHVQRQFDRVDSGQSPAKHSVGYWAKRVKPE